MAKQNYLGLGRAAGVLMPLSSLPSPYGIGSMGEEAFDFIDLLADCGQSCWQVLPLNPTSYGDSPYQSPASMAGNPYFIDLPSLRSDGLLTAAELATARTDGKRVDYGRLFSERYSLLRLASSRFTPDRDYYSFLKKNADWIEDYALFMALKVRYSYRPWVEWDECHRDVRSARAYASELKEECDFWKFVQYTFFTQWQIVHGYARMRGIKIIGDMPIYVAHDSMDVWCAPEQFLLDSDLMPKRVAGCPPDAYAEDGQLWGNPIYDWERMEREDFAWWCSRVKRSFGLYDILRIDHFRGFAGYYSIPFGEPTARQGEWRGAPGKALFDRIRSAFPKAKIIAEDLGFITDDVRELLAHTGFPGMKMLQFAFYDPNSEYLPHTYTKDNCVVYTSSHDSDCTRSWYATLDKSARAIFRKECNPQRGESSTAALIRCAMQSRADLAIVPMQDYLELGTEGRMNVPSEAEGNWQWRMSKRYDTPTLRARMKGAAKSGGRFKKRKPL